MPSNYHARRGGEALDELKADIVSDGEQSESRAEDDWRYQDHLLLDEIASDKGVDQLTPPENAAVSTLLRSSSATAAAASP